MFHSKKKTVQRIPDNMEPVLLVSICTGETTASFRDKTTGKTVGICLIQEPSDLERFKSQYGISGDIPKVY